MERSETVFEWLARRRNVTVEEIKADGRGDLLYLPDDWEG